MAGTNLDTNLPPTLNTLRVLMTAYATREVGQLATMPALVKRDLALDSIAKKTDKITVSVSGKLVDRPESNGIYPANIQALSRRNIDLTLFSREVPFELTNQDYRQMDINKNILPDSIIEASRASAVTINSRLLNQYRDVYNISGDITKSNFAADHSSLTSAYTLLNGTPTSNRHVVLNQFDADRALNLSSFTTGNNSTILDSGDLGTKLGFKVHTDNEMITHVAGTGTGILVNGTAAKGATQVTIDTGTGTLMYGDIITFAGHTQTYVVGKGAFESVQNADDAAQSVALDYTSVADVSAAIVDIYPPLVVEVADNTAVTVMGDHNVSLAFQQNAFIYAPRQVVNMGNPEFSRTMVDPVTNTPIKLTVVSGWNQQATVLSTYYGIGTLYPDFAVRMIGLPNV